MPAVPNRPDLLQLWGVVQRAVNDPAFSGRLGSITQNIYESYKQGYLAIGETPPPLSIFDVNPIVSLAFGQRQANYNLSTALETFAATGLDQAITGRMSAADLDAAQEALALGVQSYRVRFEVGLTVEGEPQTQFYTWEAGLELPGTTGGLLDALDQVGRGAAEDYGLDYNGLTGSISITTF